MKRCLGMLGLVVLLLAGCADQAPLAPDASEPDVLVQAADEVAALETEMQNLAADLAREISALGKHNNVIEVPAGSNDALADAIAEAGPGGTVLLRAGMHTESGTVTISQRVKIVGEAGAVLKVDTGPWPDAPIIEPALYVLNTSHVVIWGVEIQPLEGQTGGTAILAENAPHTVVGKNSIYGHQFGVIIQEGDHARIWNNTVVTVGLDSGLLTNGIVVSVGGHVHVVRNDVSGAFIGIFGSDEKGLLAMNDIHDNVLGVVLCNLLPMPGPGATIVAEFSATEWTVIHNHAHDNLDIGYLVVDGANANLVTNNAASNNGSYDIELAGVTTRFGFETPTTYENQAVAGRYEDITIKDCGVGNTVIGGDQVDTAADPCF